MPQITFAGGTSALVLLSLVSLSSVAHAEFNLEYGGRIQSNVRFRISDLEAGDFYDQRKFQAGVSRNEHILKLRAAATTDRFAGIIDVDFVWLNFSRDVGTFEDLSRREFVEFTRLEAHSAYLEGTDLLFDGLDLRIGQQVVSWGVGDGFNPTNNLAADDIEDRLLYGVQQANLMARLMYAFEDYISAEAVVVPVFKPALLPNTGEIALALVDRLPMLDRSFRHQLIAQNTFFGSNEAFPEPDELRRPTRVSNLVVDTPDPRFENIQFGFRLGTNILEQDISVNYYQGFADIPIPVRNDTVYNEEIVCNDPSIDPLDPDTDQATIKAGCVQTLDTTTTLTYPRMRVVGLNWAGEIPVLGLGYWVEVGLHFPEQRRMRLFQTNINYRGLDFNGEYNYDGGNFDEVGDPPLVLDSTPFAKWVVGLDYTFSPNFYMNVQWVHGLADEFGAGDWISEGYTVRQSFAEPGLQLDQAGTLQEVTVQDCALAIAGLGQDPGVCAREILRPRLGDYIVLGLDIIFDSSRGLLRLFAIFDVTPMYEEDWSETENQRVRRRISPFSEEGFSMVLFPELNYNFGSGFELGAGALVFFGREYTKFGDPATGGSVIWTRARYSF